MLMTGYTEKLDEVLQAGAVPLMSARRQGRPRAAFALLRGFVLLNVHVE